MKRQWIPPRRVRLLFVLEMKMRWTLVSMDLQNQRSVIWALDR